MSTYTLAVEAEPKPEDIGFLKEKVRAYNEAHGLDVDAVRHQLGIFIRGEDGKINGGVCGGFSGSWLFIDTLWVHERLRGQDYGTRLMRAIEQAADEYGVASVILGTFDFQARPFYEKLGYRIYASLDNVLGTYANYLMVKDNLTKLPGYVPEFTVEDPPREEDVATLISELGAYNTSQVGEMAPAPVMVSLRDEANTLVGGAVGGVLEGLCQLPYIWVEESLRRQGYGSRLLAALEEKAVAMGATRTMTMVTGPLLLPFFQKAGYDVFTSIDDYPAGKSTSILMKERPGEKRG